MVFTLIDPLLNETDSRNRFFNSLPLFDNQGLFIRMYDTLQMLTIIFTMFWYPFIISFELQSDIYVL